MKANQKRCGNLTRRFSGVMALVCLIAAPLFAERLAIKTYTVADGLAHGSVNRIFQDAKGYIWLATNEGLSRFDNYRFTNYGVGDGLPHVFINDVTADRQGRLWVATNGGGVARLMDDPIERRAARDVPSLNGPPVDGKKFVSYLVEDGGEKNKANLVNRILFDAANRLWCVTDAGLYRAKSIGVVDKQFERVAPGTQPYTGNGVLSDSRARLWFGVNARAIQVADGQVTSSTPAREINPAGQSSFFEHINSIVETKGGLVLAADAKNIYEFVEPASGRDAWRRLPLALSSDQYIVTVHPARDGGLWIGTTAGLIRYRDGQQALYTTANGLSANHAGALFTDRENNLWIGMAGGGLNKLTGESV
ncbi:MAG TPA: two-component regulator propeller domain-containing protein, partial [Pyrinomonadaceae bacterium]|nr:two-component regulator propeller domain-containing protein [Pyrinomonadaceae bacterium]